MICSTGIVDHKKGVPCTREPVSYCYTSFVEYILMSSIYRMFMPCFWPHCLTYFYCLEHYPSCFIHNVFGNIQQNVRNIIAWKKHITFLYYRKMINHLFHVSMTFSSRGYIEKSRIICLMLLEECSIFYHSSSFQMYKYVQWNLLLSKLIHLQSTIIQ